MKLQEVQVNSGLIYKLPVAESVEEFDTLAKKTGACLESANDNEVYRSGSGGLPAAHYATALLLNREHNIPFVMKDHPDAKKDAAGKVIKVRGESDPKYVSRVAAELGVDETEFQPLADRICTEGWDEEVEESVKGPDGKMTKVSKTVHHTLVFDPSVRERQVKIPTPGKKDLEQALFLMQDEKRLAKALKKIAETLGRVVVVPDSDGTPESALARQTAVALGIRDYGHELAKAAKQGLAG